MSAEPRPRRVVIGLDVGTTATKVVAFDLDSPWRFAIGHEYPLLEPEPGWQVQEPAVIAAAVRRCLSDCAKTLGDAEVLAVSLSTAWHGLLGLADDLSPVTPIITWADARATDTWRDLRAEQDVTWLHQISGTPVHPMSPLLKLRWFAQTDQATASRVRWWMGLKDFVIWTLTGVISTELSTASGTGLLNRWTQDWSPQAAEIAMVDPDRLPPIHATSDAFGLQPSVAIEVGLASGTPVVLGAADGPLGNVGTGAVQPGVAGLSLGTSGAVRLLVPEQPAHLDASLFCYSLDETTWTLGGAISNGGLVARWLGQTLGGEDGPLSDADVLELAASVEPGSDGLVMLPYLIAERAPLWDPQVSGAYLGVRRRHGRGHFARAGIEGVALQLAVIADRVGRVQPIHAVRATGGVFAGALWAEIVAGMFAREIAICGSSSGTALGAAALGLRAIGAAPDLTTARSMLTAFDEDAEHLVRPAPALVAAYERTRDQVAAHIESLLPMVQSLTDQ